MQVIRHKKLLASLAALGAALTWNFAHAVSSQGIVEGTTELIEQATSFAFLDTAPGASALGDQLVGTGDLIDRSGNKVGTSSFHCVSTHAKPRTSEICTFVYVFPGGRITATGHASISAGTPIFDEAFALTGGTGIYQRVRGEVQVRQESETRAVVTFRLRH